ncbi:MAG: hypothetical protein AAFU79_35755, partial [Myxococcota bacterium]
TAAALAASGFVEEELSGPPRVVVLGSMSISAQIRVRDELASSGYDVDLDPSGSRPPRQHLRRPRVQAVIEVGGAERRISVWVKRPRVRQVIGPPLVPGRDDRILALQVSSTLELALSDPSAGVVPRSEVPAAEPEARPPRVPARYAASGLGAARFTDGDASPGASLRFGLSPASRWWVFAVLSASLLPRRARRSDDAATIVEGALTLELEHVLGGGRSPWRGPLGVGAGVAWTWVDGEAPPSAQAREGLLTTPLVTATAALEYRLDDTVSLRLQGQARGLIPQQRILLRDEVALARGPFEAELGFGFVWFLR